MAAHKSAKKRSKKSSSKRASKKTPKKKKKLGDGNRFKVRKAKKGGTLAESRRRPDSSGTRKANSMPIGLLKERHKKLGALILRREALGPTYGGVAGMRIEK